MMNVSKYFALKAGLCLVTLGLFSSCEKLYDLPEDKQYLSNEVNFTVTNLKGVLGRTSIMSTVFNADNSNYPLKFEILNVKNIDGTPSDALYKTKPVQVWKERYLGNETSIEEIEKKRVIEERPVFEIRSSGEMVLWSSAKNADLLKPNPDSLYTFDIKVSNSGGEKVLGPMKFIPVRERPYEPSYIFDPVTGNPVKEINNAAKRLIPTTLVDMLGATSGQKLILDKRAAGSTAINGTVQQDVWVYLNRVGDGKSLSIKFMDQDSVAINPSKFNGTDFPNLVHGFNMNKTATFVKYDVAYPIPLTKWPTKYTNPDGSQALLTFKYNRIGFGGFRETGIMTFNFNIYQEGDWEMIFYFHNETPKFEDQ